MVFLLKAEPRYIHAGGRRGGFSASAQGVIGRLPVSDLLKEGSRNEAEDNTGKETREYEISSLLSRLSTSNTNTLIYTIFYTVPEASYKVKSLNLKSREGI